MNHGYGRLFSEARVATRMRGGVAGAQGEEPTLQGLCLRRFSMGDTHKKRRSPAGR
jgi:hypothetical protein